MKVCLELFRSPGDTILLSGAIRDLHLTYPGKFTTSTKTFHQDIFLNNPYVTPIDNSHVRVSAEPLLTESMSDARTCTMHYMHGYRKRLESIFKVPIRPHCLGGDVHIGSDEESPAEGPYWILNAGWKSDYQVKRWDPLKWLSLAETLSDIHFVQTGLSKHSHPLLDAPNVEPMFDLSLRDFLLLIHGCSGVVTPVSMPMHACAAVPCVSGIRPCVVLAGGRECDVWEHYSGHTYISRVGTLPCCSSGGCRKARFHSTGDGWCHDGALCEDYVLREDLEGFPLEVARCMDSIGVDEVASAIRRYQK